MVILYASVFLTQPLSSPHRFFPMTFSGS